MKTMLKKGAQVVARAYDKGCAYVGGKKAEILTAVGTTVAAGSASAQTSTTFDVSGAVTLINGDIKTAVMQVGTAVIGLAAVAMGIRWVKATFF